MSCIVNVALLQDGHEGHVCLYKRPPLNPGVILLVPNSTTSTLSDSSTTNINMVIASRSGLLLARSAASRSWKRSSLLQKNFSTSRVLLDDGVLTTSNVKVKKPIGGFRGG